MIDGEVEEVWLCFPHCVLHHHRQEDWHCLYLQLRNEYTVTSPLRLLLHHTPCTVL